jgi:two-component system nitrate/nitrite response regulator NarL
MDNSGKTTVMACETQPITAEGLKNLISGSPDLDFLGAENSLERLRAVALRQQPDIVVVDKAFGMRAVLDWIHELKLAGAVADIVVWGVSMTEAEALRLLQAGARGIVRKTAALPTLLACMGTVAAGQSWMEDAVFRESIAPANQVAHSELTAREQQVLGLVEQGFKNREIAMELGIRPGTVKIHLKHIFEKTGVRGRYGLAINGLKDKGLVSLAS